MRNTFKYALLLVGMTSLPAMAHIGYSGRDFGTFTAAPGATSTIINQSFTGNFGWIDGTDADWGDSHRVRAYKFSLTEEADVSITFSGLSYVNSAGATVLGDTNPGFSLYKGLAHGSTGTGGQADHDFGPGSEYIRDRDSGGAATEGSFRGLESWAITNNSWNYEGGAWVNGPTAANPGATTDPVGVLPESFFQYIGHAYDGSSIDYGTGAIPGADGLADHMVSQVFHLTAGDYSIFVGGTDYFSQGVDPRPAYGLTGVVSVVPEPETYAMLLAGLGLLGFSARRRQAV
ncbi:FxDxF family PEP-CTERM protein [Nitrosomonas sp.]|uniref:FxDxF family PEP-CTERM protein n=1 Tax=Nitrosomonas sp. TaxID=42353 RepID=UPI00271B6F65|nr:FxDxF family PEP-CTERM protein [Nitrosomonas sp.]MDO8894909.1 FxDxF family PEP-CTERM protein [Nitrosomonas sp.]